MDIKHRMVNLIQSAEKLISSEEKENALRTVFGLPDAATAAAAVVEAKERDAATNQYAAEADRLLTEYKKETARVKYWYVKPRNFAAGRTILDEIEPRLQVAVARRVFSRTSTVSGRYDTLKTALLARNLPYTSEDLESLLQIAASNLSYYFTETQLLRHLKRFLDKGGTLTPKMSDALIKIHKYVKDGYSDPGYRKVQNAIEEILGLSSAARPEPGEAWADAAITDLDAMTPQEQTTWGALIAYALTAEGTSKPSARWLKEVQKHIETIGPESFLAHVTRWFGRVSPPAHVEWGETREGVYGYTGVNEKNITLLKGLAWCCATRTEPEVSRTLARLAEVCYRKVPRHGSWAQRAGSGAIWALGAMEGTEPVAQLGRLKLKINHRPTQAAIDRTIEAAAKKAGIPREDLEDMAVPTYGFDANCARRETFGDYSATVVLTDTGTLETNWYGPGEKSLKSVPAEVKRSHADELKALKADADAAHKMLSAQQRRIESFYLTERVWKFGEWRERYLSHPVLGNLAERLIWHFSDTGGDRKAQGMPDREREAFVDIDGRDINWLTDDTEVRLWHPLGFDVETVLQWRTLLEERQIRQPFKQAHREVYILTDAELNTNTYSNRFAGHILRQHQMNSLAIQKGWKYSLQGAFDGGSDGPASITLPHWNLKAEFWVEAFYTGAYNHQDYSDSGMWNNLSTDQGRFYRADTKEQIPLTEVPALPFSEVMRDVDLFVGVASIGNDPTWQDRGADRTGYYWHEYSFGDLSASANTRKDVLSRLLPRLKIRDRCTLDGKFLKVRGDLRTYKIHLGSGNILMEPNDQYLCIVQDRSATGAKDTGSGGSLFLPFEGDQRLSLILSKAFLLADDTKITDPTITRQIKTR